MDMLLRKKMLKIQERLGMRIGISYGISSIPVIKTPADAMNALRELYKVGAKAFVLPKDMFSEIQDPSDLYKSYYGDLLRIKEEASKLNIELSVRHPGLSDMPDDEMRIFCSITSIMDNRTFIIRPNFYRNMPKEQSLTLAVHKINEIMAEQRGDVKMGIETTGNAYEPGSLDDVIDVVKRTKGTEPIINWAHIHARGTGALRSENDYRRVIEEVVSAIGQGWLRNSYMFFGGVSYGPSGVTGSIPLRESDMKLEYLIKQIMSFGMQGTLILEDPAREKLILSMLDDLARMVR